MYFPRGIVLPPDYISFYRASANALFASIAVNTVFSGENKYPDNWNKDDNIMSTTNVSFDSFGQNQSQTLKRMQVQSYQESLFTAFIICQNQSQTLTKMQVLSYRESLLISFINCQNQSQTLNRMQVQSS